MRDLMLQLREHMGQADKEECFQLVLRMLGLSRLARMSGVLALEAETSEEPDIFFRTGIELVVDGTCPGTVEQILRNLILAGGYSGTELLKRLVIAESVLALQQGENPYVFTLRLASMLGEEYLDRAVEAASADMRECEYNRTLGVRKAIPESAEFQELFRILSCRDVSLILRHVDLWTAVDAFSGCDGEFILYTIRPAVSQRRFVRICDGIMNTRSESLYSNSDFQPELRCVLDAQEALLAEVRRLQDTGEIIIPETLSIRRVPPSTQK